jgi:hypothetical protein
MIRMPQIDAASCSENIRGLGNRIWDKSDQWRVSERRVNVGDGANRQRVMKNITRGGFLMRINEGTTEQRVGSSFGVCGACN